MSQARGDSTSILYADWFMFCHFCIPCYNFLILCIMYNWFIRFPNFTVRIPSFPCSGGVTWNRRREIPTADPKKLLSLPCIYEVNVVSHLSGFKGFTLLIFFSFLMGREEWEILIDEDNSGCDCLWPPARRLGMRARSYSLLANRCTTALRWPRFGEDWRNLDHVPSHVEPAGFSWIEHWMLNWILPKFGQMVIILFGTSTAWLKECH